MCTADDVSLFSSLRCPDGTVGEGPDCHCPQENCSIAYLRSYLPNLSDIETAYNNSRLLKCNRDAYFGLAEYRVQHSQFVSFRGYPLHVHCSPEIEEQAVAARAYNYCLNSLGKYLRYNSLMVFHHMAGAEVDLVPETEYPATWRNSRHVSACKRKGRRLDGWNCLFNKLSETMRDAAGQYQGFVAFDIFNHIGRIRRNRRDHVAQMILYGHALTLMATPSEAVLEYLHDHLAELHADVASGDGADLPFAPSVSMHVRQGDSCDFVLLDEDGDAEGYGRTRCLNAKKNYTRPCYSINVYMKKLHMLRKKYGVRRVYLATDSPDMIARAQRETRFHWIYVDSPKSALHHGKGWVDFHAADDSEDVTLSAVADLTLLQAGDIFLGAFTSHFSKLTFYLMVGQQMRIPPFVSLDYPLSCDTVDNCSDNDITRRGLSIADIIGWAPECVRAQHGGWVRDNLDACGVYMSTQLDKEE